MSVRVSQRAGYETERVRPLNQPVDSLMEFWTRAANLIAEAKGVKMKPLFYALIVVDAPGRIQFAGAFQTRQMAERKGAELRKQFKVEEVRESDF